MFVGIFAAPSPPLQKIGIPIIIFVILVFVLFLLQLLSFSDRIRILESYANPPPGIWFQDHKDKAKCWASGEGSSFFVLLMVCIGGVNAGLLYLKGFF